MRILYITDTLLTGGFAWRLKERGNEVRLCILNPEYGDCYRNILPTMSEWRTSLEWVGKDGLVIFDDVGFADEQVALRKEGYAVFGGGPAERLEKEREFGHRVLTEHGLKTVPLNTFATCAEAIGFIRKNTGAWVLKFDNGHWMKPYAFVGNDVSGDDVIAVLQNYERYHINADTTVTLQQRIFGVEMGVARYFNGRRFVGPIEYNVEHSHLFPGAKGPIVDEMGTLAWYSDDENERLYRETLALIEPYLRRTDFRGNFDIDCIINDSGAHPIEVTARLGAPIIYLQDTMHLSPWNEFLFAIARGEDYDLRWRPGFGVVTSVVIPPFPYRNEDIGRSILGTKIHLRDNFHEKDMDKHIYFDEVASHDGSLGSLHIAGRNGYAFYATGLGTTVKEARLASLRAIESVYVPRMFYREDIGESFERADRALLHEWGYPLGLK